MYGLISFNLKCTIKQVFTRFICMYLIHYIISYNSNYTPHERSSGGCIGITLSVRLSVQIGVRPITFLWFDIGILYLAHGSITKRGCVKYIHDPDMTFTFDLKVKFIGFMT